LYVRQGTPLTPQINGGGQERRRRAGTENVPGIVGFAHALRLAEERRTADVAHYTVLRDRLSAGLIERIPLTFLNGHPSRRLPNNVNVSFEYADGESILMLLDQQGFCASAGSACTAGAIEPSHVLLALGVPPERAMGTIRFTVGRSTTTADIDRLLDLLPGMVERLRSTSPEYRRQLAEQSVA
jgi:cysteine desulfurase